jgi:hypothetical protein
MLALGSCPAVNLPVIAAVAIAVRPPAVRARTTE